MTHIHTNYTQIIDLIYYMCIQRYISKYVDITCMSV